MVSTEVGCRDQRHEFGNAKVIQVVGFDQDEEGLRYW